MSYTRGKLWIVENGDYVCDSKEYYRQVEPGTVFLSHSCDEWVIGGKAEVQQLVSDLREILEKWPG